MAAGLLAYAITYRAPSRVKPNTIFAYDEQIFHSTRAVTNAGFQLHSIEFKTEGGDVAVEWYDSSLASVAAKSGIYTTLYIDGQHVVNALTGSYLGRADRGPGTLRWAGWLPAGDHRFQIELSRIDTVAEAPYVQRGHIGVDNLVITQESGDG